MKRILIYIALLIGLTACTKDPFVDPGAFDPGALARYNVALLSSDFKVVQTRLSEGQENTWTNVWIAQFKTSGELVGSPIERLKSQNNFTLDLTDIGSEQSIVYFVCNVSSNPFQGINTMDEFKNSEYAPASLTENNQLAMLGTWKGVVQAGQPIEDIEVYVKKIAAKIKVIIKADQSLVGKDFYFGYIRATDFQLKGVPKRSYYDTEYVTQTASDVTDMPPVALTKIDAKSSETVYYYESPEYYVFENMHGLGTNKVAPQSDGDKNENAPKDGDVDLATHILISARMDDGKFAGKVDYKIYLGKDPRFNFDIERHTFYTITVTLKGNGEVTTDIRAERDELRSLQVQYLNGNNATSRSYETTYVNHETEEWGIGSSTNSADVLKLFTGSSHWGFELKDITTSSAGVVPNWVTLHYSTDKGATWVPAGISASNLPTNPEYGVRFKLVMAKNPSFTTDRSLKILFHNQDDPSIVREWRVIQLKQAAFVIPPFVYFGSEAGVYTVPVRVEHDPVLGDLVGWKVVSVDNGFTLAGILDKTGTSVSTTNYTAGHGTILINAPGSSTIPFSKGKITLTHKMLNGDPEEVTSTIDIRQFVPYSTLQSATPRYYYYYSSNPMFESFLASSDMMPWAMDLLEKDMDYMTSEYKLEATSMTNGRLNTMKVFDAIDKYLYPSEASDLPANTKPGIITPAGLCVMMNNNFMSLSETTASTLEWYLPGRYEALMDATSVMLGLPNVASGVNTTLWSSSTFSSADNFTQVRYSAFFGGTSVDVSGAYSATSRTRCIRDLDLPTGERTYPYLMKNEYGYPVVVTVEETPGGTKGYNEGNNYTSLNGYKIGRPKRFVKPGDEGNIIGTGPTMPLELTLSPKFQVASHDIKQVDWVTASGWNSSVTDIAADPTGCMTYREGNFTDWRVPTELELRIIGLLGASGHANIPKLSNADAKFDKATFPDFDPMNGTYWSNRQYLDGTSYNRAAYVTISSQISGTATKKGMEYNVRCVRDVK